MKGERIFVADDQQIVIDGLKAGIEVFGEMDGHKIIGSANSVSEVEKLIKEGLKPSVALVDNRFPEWGDGERAAKIIKEISPEIVVVAFSSDHVTWGDYWWHKHEGIRELVKKLTELQH
jgi:DNA-binding NarL/FixJ family response regulator